MRERLIAGTATSVTELGFGGASLGNLYTETSEQNAGEAVAEAWRCGIRYFDTAPHYGLGLSERRLGAALGAYPREEAIISTKVGRLIVPNEEPTEWDTQGFRVPGSLRREWDFSRDGILRSIEASLERLNTDYIDILYLHDPDLADLPDGGVAAAEVLIDLRDQGVVSVVGVGANEVDVITHLFRETAIDTAMVAGRYTLLETDGSEAVFDAAGERSIVAVGVFNSGILANPRPSAGAHYNYGAAPDEIIERANLLADIAERGGVTLPHAAVQFALLNERVATVALGMRTAEQVRANVALYEASIPASVWDDYRANGVVF